MLYSSHNKYLFRGKVILNSSNNSIRTKNNPNGIIGNHIHVQFCQNECVKIFATKLLEQAFFYKTKSIESSKSTIFVNFDKSMILKLQTGCS